MLRRHASQRRETVVDRGRPIRGWLHVCMASAISALLLATPVAHSAPATGAPMTPRPSELRPTDPHADLAYQRRSSTVEGRRVVVHYITKPGDPDAPPLTDRNLNGIPDYAGSAAYAADRALDFYDNPASCVPTSAGEACVPSPRYRAVRPDCGGPDSRIDIYIINLRDIGVEGRAVPTRCRTGFVLVDSRLVDPAPAAPPPVDSPPISPDAHLWLTVGHELFHLVQFAYTKEMAPWLAEGTANAAAVNWMVDFGDETNVDVYDPRAQKQFESWLGKPVDSIFGGSEDASCDPCYDRFLWWSRMMSISPGVLQRTFALLAAEYRAHPRVSNRRQLAILGQAYAERARLRPQIPDDPNATLLSSFSEFASEMYTGHYEHLGLTAPLRASAIAHASVPALPRSISHGRAVPGLLKPLSIQYVPLQVPGAPQSMRIQVEYDRGPKPSVLLMLPTSIGEGFAGRLARRVRGVDGRPRPKGAFRRTITVTANFMNERERSTPMLILTGQASQVRFRVRLVVA